MIETWDILQLVYCTEICLQYPTVHFALFALFLAVRCKSVDHGITDLVDRAEEQYAKVMESDSNWKTEFVKWRTSLEFLRIFAAYVQVMKVASSKVINTRNN